MKVVKTNSSQTLKRTEIGQILKPNSKTSRYQPSSNNY